MDSYGIALHLIKNCIVKQNSRYNSQKILQRNIYYGNNYIYFKIRWYYMVKNIKFKAH